MFAEHFTENERHRLVKLCIQLMHLAKDTSTGDELPKLRRLISECVESGHYQRDKYGINPALRHLDTAVTLCQSISPDRSMIIAILLYGMCQREFLTADEIERQWGDDIAKLVKGLIKVSSVYAKSAAVESENFRNLLLTFAQDIRVIIIMIVDRLSLMRSINHHPNEKFVKDVAFEASYLYAPLAHRLGLYAIKSELEDMAFKYTNRETYTSIARKLNETKSHREAYISDFIKPVKSHLDALGLKYEIKGRTKSISSIWNKIKKQKVDLEGIYDLFAIRVILDSPLEREKSDCWNVYSVIADMYTPNPARMKDWLSIPKSNGYESLHTTVNGPDDKWVEVQIRTKRMDEIAEKGLAAHWKYKGIKAENNLDAWMNNVRDILEAADTGPMELMKHMRMDVYDHEIFVFTPKGDLYKLPLGACVLDFAFNIHSRIGCQCTGAKVNGRHQKINYKLRSGDTVEIITSSTQSPKLDWLAMVVTSKAKSKIKQTIKEQGSKSAELGKELLSRRFKNRKIEIEEAKLMKLIKKLGFKTSTEFFNSISNEELNVNEIIDNYLSIDQRPADSNPELRSAEEFVVQPHEETSSGDDILVIGDDVKGLNYRMAKCCNPIYGDSVFGFVSAEGVVKIHRDDCPNSRNIREKYPYRIITTRWSGKLGQQFGATLRVVGHDDIGIVTNITSIINKERGTSLRSISIDSHDGLFQGFLVVGIEDTLTLNNLIKKIKTVKGVKDVERSK